MEVALSQMFEKIKVFFLKLKDKLTDKYTRIIFIAVVLTLSSEVWLAYLLGIIFRSPYLIGVGSVCWAFWLGPFTPFLPIAFLITFSIRKFIGKKFGK